MDAERGSQAGDLSHEMLAKRNRGRGVAMSLASLALIEALNASPVFADHNVLSPANRVEQRMDLGPSTIDSIIIDYPKAPIVQKTKRAAAYDFRLDVADRRALDTIFDPLLREERLEEQKRYVKRQVETLLGEKLHIRVRQTRYDFRDGRLYGEDMQVPAIESFKKGRDHRRLHGNSADYNREDAEIDGIELIESEMRSVDVGDMMFFPSPPGGTYPGNFYDVATKKVDERGEYVEFKRYSSALTYPEYRDFLREMGIETPDEPDDVFFLSHPIRLDRSRFPDADSVHAYLHREHGYMEPEEFQLIMRLTQSAVSEYAENPSLFNLKVVINMVDEIRDERKGGVIRIYTPAAKLDRYERERLGNKEVKEEDLPCGALNLNSVSIGSGDTVPKFKRSYEYDDYGSCKGCGGEKPLGPCGICEPCDAKARRESGKLG